MTTKTRNAAHERKWIGAGREAARRIATDLIEKEETDFDARDELLAAAATASARRDVQEWLAANAPETLEDVDDTAVEPFLDGFITECRENLP